MNEKGNRCCICGYDHVYSPSEQMWFGQDINNLELAHINHFKDILSKKSIQDFYLKKEKKK